MTSYYQNTSYISNSSLSRLIKDLSAEVERDLTDAYRFGALFDAMLTEPERLDLIQRTIQGTDYVFTKEEHEACKAMRKAFLADPYCANVLKMFDTQTEIYADDLPITHNGITFTLPMKGRFDFNNWAMETVIDLKSTKCKTQKQFEDSCTQFGYWRQMAVYMKLSGAKRAMLIGVSRHAPHPIFKVPLVYGDLRWQIGQKQFEELAYKYWAIKN